MYIFFYIYLLIVSLFPSSLSLFFYFLFLLLLYSMFLCCTFIWKTFINHYIFIIQHHNAFDCEWNRFKKIAWIYDISRFFNTCFIYLCFDTTFWRSLAIRDETSVIKYINLLLFLSVYIFCVLLSLSVLPYPRDNSFIPRSHWHSEQALSTPG